MDLLTLAQMAVATRWQPYSLPPRDDLALEFEWDAMPGAGWFVSMRLVGSPVVLNWWDADLAYMADPAGVRLTYDEAGVR